MEGRATISVNSQLGLGTVQFGLDYGISNREGKTTPAEVSLILRTAAASGITLLDTAFAYGQSEEILGQNLPREHNFKIVTKTPGLPPGLSGSEAAGELERFFRISLDRTGQSSLYGLLLHRAGDLIGHRGQHLMDRMLLLKEQRLVEKVGVSVYGAEETDRVIDGFEIDIIQLPLNVFDQRMLANGRLKELKRAGVETHIRSVFLQGLLLMDPEELPSYFESIRGRLKKFRALAFKNGISPLQAALGFVAGREEVDHFLCGVNNALQLTELIRAMEGPRPAAVANELTGLAVQDESVLNPSLWRRSGAPGG